MRQFGRRAFQRPRQAAILFAALSPLALLVPAIAVSSDSAAAAASLGYTASLIPVPTATPAPVAVNPVTGTVYLGVVNNGDDLTVINPSARAIIATIPLAAPPVGVAVDYSTDTVYALSAAEVEVINGATNSVSATIPLPAGVIAAAIAADSTTNLIYVTNRASSAGSVLAIDGNPSTATTNTVIATVSTGTGEARGIAIDESADLVWVADLGGAAVAFNGTTDSVIHSVPVTGGPLSIAVNPLTHTVYVAPTVGSDGLAVIDGSAGTVTATVPVTTSGPVVVDPTANAVFTQGAGTVVIDGASNAVADVIGLPNAGANGVAVNPGAAAVYVSSSLGLWVITPSASNGISPLMSGPGTATAAIGTEFQTAFTVLGQPAPTVTETGPLPAGLTLSPAGAITGIPAAGTAGVYPITVTASNGVAPDFSLPLTLTVTGPAVAVGVEGTDGQLWVQSPLGSGWQPLGGVITAPPAVIAPPNQGGVTPVKPWFLATGLDQRLWIRSLTANWQPTGPAECLGGPAATVTGTGASAVVTVACRGLDSALWYTTTPLAALPAFTGTWTRVPSGVLSAAPAVAPVGTTMTFMVRGLDGAIWMYSATAGWSRTGWLCTTAPAAAQQPGGGITTFACQGSDHMLWRAYNLGLGTGWTVPVSLGGPITGSPGIAATTPDLDILVEGLDQAVWERTAVSWSRIYASITGGVGATGLN